MKRRSFLKQATAGAAALGFPVIVPGAVFGKNAPSNRIHHAVIGSGPRARFTQLGRFGDWTNDGSTLGFDDVRIVACCDPWRHRRESFARLANAHYGRDVCTPYADFRDILAREDIDSVQISTPDHWHTPMAILALAAGKDVYLEKPLSVAMTWTQPLRAVAARTGRIFQYGTQQRSMRQFRRACELVRNGYIGAVEEVHAWCPDMTHRYDRFKHPPYGVIEPEPVPPGLDYDQWLGPAPMAPYTAERCISLGAFSNYDYTLGFIQNWGVHTLDIQQWGLDMDRSGPVRMEGRGVVAPPGGLMNTTLSWDVEGRYANGVKLRFMGRTAAEAVVKAYHYAFRDHGTTFFGSEGWISVDRQAMYSSGRNALRKIELKAGDARLPVSDNHQRNFFDGVRTRIPPICDLETAIRSEALCHLADISIRTRKPVDWDPATESIPGSAPDQQALLDRPMREPYGSMVAAAAAEKQAS